MNSDEHILLRKLREGDTEALDILYLRYAAKVRDFAFRLLGDSVEAEDITHDIFLKVWEQRKTLGNVVSFRGYLFRMTRNAIFNAFKHRQVESKYQARAAEDGTEAPCRYRRPRIDERPDGDDRPGGEQYARAAA